MYDDFLKVAEDVALKAGKGVREARESKGFTVDIKSGIDLVTTADRASEELIIGTLKKQFSDHEFIGEESAGALPTSASGALVLSDKPTWIMCVLRLDRFL